ncbi:VWA domain-containing protein [Lysinibacillus sp. 54212]|uniref:VWA domain-containing protein n=1 Tax=Lysinibacillus sp. 54212 TaxID=3119829 RepID=UPI002FC9E6FF
MAVFATRILTVSILVLALANPYLLLPLEKEQVVFLIDRSASIKGEGDSAVKFINDSLDSKQEHQDVGIYSFAERLQTEVLLSNKLDSVPELSTITMDSQTNISNALQLVSGIADRQKATRIVLLSDGLQTKGNALDEVTKFSNSNVTVDVVPLTKPALQDVVIESFTSPQVAFDGEEQLLITEISSSTRTTASLTLYENDVVIHQQDVTLEEGDNRFTYSHIGSAQGLVKYEAMIGVENDAVLENNKLTSATTVKAPPRALIVHNHENGTSIPSILGENTIAYDVMSAADLPSSLSSYLAYNAIIFDNVPGHLVGEAKMDVIEQAVKHFGVGFMMVGGENSFGLGGYFKTPIEALLPVEMEVKGKHELPTLGLVLVIDRSGSMMGSKMELAKEAAARSIELLRDSDTLGVIAFDSKPWEVIKTAMLKDKKDALDKVSSIPANGGTEIYSSLELAYKNLQDLPLQRKHIILLTDGQSATNSSYEDLLSTGLDKNVTLSTVAIGSDADRTLLENLSLLGNGRFYDVTDATMIPSILSRETAMISRTYIEDNPFYPTVYNATNWNTLFNEGVPEMNAYIGTTAKAMANVIAESDKEDPILAQWQYGLGTTIAFTSDSSGAWAGDWARWENWRKLWQTAIAEMLPSYHEVAYDIKSQGNGSYIITDSTNEAAFLNIAAVNEQGGELPIEIEVLSSSKVRVTVDSDPGLIFFSVANKEGQISQSGIHVPYGDEYAALPSNTAMLKKIAELGNGKLLEDPEEAFREFKQQGVESKSISHWLLLAAMLLFFMDITLRRFGWSFVLALKGKSKPTKEYPIETNVGKVLQKMKKK